MLKVKIIYGLIGSSRFPDYLQNQVNKFLEKLGDRFISIHFVGLPGSDPHDPADYMAAIIVYTEG